jgi:hypothetical protein
MNSLEDRLREALRERAGQSPVSPDAWSRTLARTRRRTWSPAWTRFVIPVAAAAAMVAIIVGAGLLAGHRGPRGTDGTSATGSATAPATATPPAPPGPDEYLMRGTPPITAVVPIKLTADGKTTWTFVWFGYMKSARDQGIALCSVTDGPGYYGSGSCGAARVPPGKVAASGGGPNSIRLGPAVLQAASVTALLPGGRRVPGVLASGRGFPYKVWAVAYPQPSNAQVVFADTGGRRLGQLSLRGDYRPPARPHSGGIPVFRYPAGTLEPSAGTMTAYLLDGRAEGVGGHVVGFWDSSSSSAVSVVPAGGPPAVGVFGGGFGQHTTQIYFYGYAHENVRRVVLRLAGGKQYGAQTSAAWAGSGLRLWDFSVPVSLRSSFASAVLIGYDAAGQVVWQKPLPAAAP